MMKAKLTLATLFMLLTIFCIAQSGVSLAGETTKGTLKQNDNSEKTAATAVESDSPTVKSFDVAEGKKGLNAVNVRNAKQTANSTNTQNTSPPESGTASSPVETKYAINTKGTGATRDGAGKDK